MPPIISCFEKLSMFFLFQSVHGAANPGRSLVRDRGVNQSRFHIIWPALGFCDFAPGRGRPEIHKCRDTTPLRDGEGRPVLRPLRSEHRRTAGFASGEGSLGASPLGKGGLRGVISCQYGLHLPWPPPRPRSTSFRKRPGIRSGPSRPRRRWPMMRLR